MRTFQRANSADPARAEPRGFCEGPSASPCSPSLRLPSYPFRRRRTRVRRDRRSRGRTSPLHRSAARDRPSPHRPSTPGSTPPTNAPYNLSINWAPSNSGTGRYEFTNQTTDFAVSDIGYVGNTDTTPPSFPFNFIPITAGGIAFMYNIPGLSKQLQLSSYSACGLLTGAITNWNNQYIAADNPGVSLPNLPVKSRDRERLRRDQLRPGGMVHRRAAHVVGGVRAPARDPVGRPDRRRGHLGDLAQLELAGDRGRTRRPVHDRRRERCRQQPGRHRRGPGEVRPRRSASTAPTRRRTSPW